MNPLVSSGFSHQDILQTGSIIKYRDRDQESINEKKNREHIFSHPALEGKKD